MKKKVKKASAKTAKASAAKSRSARPAARKSTSVAAKSPAKPMGSFKYFYDVLNRKREDILRIEKDKEVDIAYGEIGDEADVASQTYEREMLFEVTNSERMMLDEIEAALRKIEKGEFAVCEACRKKITPERMRAMPWARYCIQCQTQAESPSRA